MPYRAWLFAVAIGINFTVSVKAQDQAQGADDPATTQSQPSDHNPVGIPVRIIGDSITTDARDARERQSKNREEDDLIAQERMADATEAMNKGTQSIKRAAWWSFSAVPVGNGLLIYTLLLTRKQTIYIQVAWRRSEKPLTQW